MAGTALARALLSQTSSILSLSFRTRFSSSSSSSSLSNFSASLTSLSITALRGRSPCQFLIIRRPFSDHSSDAAGATKRNPKLVNFSPSDSDSDEDEESKTATTKSKEIDKSKLPPPYDPFSKKPAIEEPEDPKNLQEVFHKISTEGLFNNEVKMFDALSKDGLTHEALVLFSQIKDKGQMPDVVVHTAVLEAYANAGQAKEAHRVYLRMLASGVSPNAYTFAVLINGLAGSGDAKLMVEAKKCVKEMMRKGMRPNAGTYVAVFEGLVREGKTEEGREFLGELKEEGFRPEEKAVKEVLRDKRGPVPRTVMEILFAH